MNRPESGGTRLHLDTALFREAVSFTAAETGFVPRLIEKDYYCTVLLEYLAEADNKLVFKGGTCLAKVHAGFYRLSEDLDFSIPTPTEASRSERSARAAVLKKPLADLSRRLPVFSIIQPLTGASRSTQYVAVVGYDSLSGPHKETIKIEVGLREPLLTPAYKGAARTILLDPVTGQPIVEPVAARAISLAEAFAEKFRAALSRRDPAIRDFFDIDFAVRRLDLQCRDEKFIGLVRRKLAIPGNESVDLSESQRLALKRQMESELKPILRPKDYAEFDLDRAFDTVSALSERIV